MFLSTWNIFLFFLQATEELLEEHYAEHKGKGFFPKLIFNMISGPVFAMVCIKIYLTS